MKDNPFSLYDFIGYLIPGIFVIYAIEIVNSIKANEIKCLNDINTSLPKLSSESLTFIILISYLIGHLLSFTSSITIEKYAIWKYGYPSKYLLNIEFPKFFDHFKTYYGFIWGGSLMLIILPLSILDYFLGNLLGFKYFFLKSLDNPLINIIKFKADMLNKKLGLTVENGFNTNEETKSDFHRVIHHYVFENSKNHQKKFTNYVALYGFLRTFTLIFILIFWYTFIHFYFFGEINGQVVCILISSALISFTFFMSFMKFYRKYTLVGLMIMVIETEVKSSDYPSSSDE